MASVPIPSSSARREPVASDSGVCVPEEDRLQRRGVVGALALVGALVVPMAYGPVAHAGSDDATPGISITEGLPDGFTGSGALQLRAIGAGAPYGDVYLGVVDLATPANRIEANLDAASFTSNGNAGSADGDCGGRYVYGLPGYPESNAFSLTWNERSDALTATLTNRFLDCTLVFGGFAREVADANGWTLAQAGDALTQVNALVLSVDGRQAGSGVALSGVTLDSEVALGGFAPGPGELRSWTVSGYDLDAGGRFLVEGSLDLMGTFGACVDTCDIDIVFGTLASGNAEPTVLAGAADASGGEGSLLSASGSFLDPDGDALTISATGAGAVTDGGDGTWSWAHVPDDDGTGTVTVTASDGNGGVATDSFEWSASNIDPEIVSLVPSAAMTLVGAPVIWIATAVDPGSGDTHVWSFEDGAGVGSGLTTTYVASYETCGEHHLQAEVRDDDGGVDAATSSERVAVFEATVLRPLDPEVVNVVRPGSMVPVRFRIGCAGDDLGGLTPLIELVGGSGSAISAPVSARDVGPTEGTYLGIVRIPTGALTLGGAGELTLRIWPLGAAGGSIDLALAIRL